MEVGENKGDLVATQKIESLYEGEQESFDMIAAHFDSVDHIIHAHGSTTPLLESSLSEMDDLLKRIIDSMENTTIIMFGDHGITKPSESGIYSTHGGNDPET